MEAIRTFSGRMMPLPVNDIDTDQIIPARFLKVTDKAGLGEACFADWRYDEHGQPQADFVMNQASYQGASVLIGGANFGCGSSREHAPWALLAAGVRAVVSTDFADIFRNNALKNGLLPIIVDSGTHQQLISLAQEDPASEVVIDLEKQQITLPDGRSVAFPIDPFAKHCLLNGLDQLGFLTSLASDVLAYERAVGDRVDTLNLQS